MIAKLILNVDIVLNGESEQAIREHIHASLIHAIGNGGLTGYSNAEVNSFNLEWVE